MHLKKISRLVNWLILDAVFVNISFYSAYLIRFKGIIELPAFIPYLRLWPHISSAHLIIFSIFKFYEPFNRFSKSEIFKNSLNASIVSSLASMSIVYMMRHFWGVIPSSVFAFTCVFNIILVCGWRVFIRYEA